MIYFCVMCSHTEKVKTPGLKLIPHIKYGSNPPAQCNYFADLLEGEAARALELLQVVREAEAARLITNR